MQLPLAYQSCYTCVQVTRFWSAHLSLLCYHLISLSGPSAVLPPHQSQWSLRCITTSSVSVVMITLIFTAVTVSPSTFLASTGASFTIAHLLLKQEAQLSLRNCTLLRVVVVMFIIRISTVHVHIILDFFLIFHSTLNDTEQTLK